jgi:DNA-binding NarL/FixJ family response regulator
MPAGRPSGYKPEFAQQAAKLCALGATDTEIADFFEVSARTLYRWKAEFPEFCQSLTVAKDVADTRVERSLYARANGYEHEEVDIRVIANEIVQTKVRKYYPPDTAAGIFWLKNRQSGKWRDRVDTTLSGPNGGPVETVTRVEIAALGTNGDSAD